MFNKAYLSGWDHALSQVKYAALPYRQRVEVIALNPDKTKVYGGLYDDGSFGVFGGGVDSNTVENAARREFKEEAGLRLKQVEGLDVEPFKVHWKFKTLTDKMKERSKHFKGSETHYVSGIVGAPLKRGAVDKEEVLLKKVKYYPLKKAISLSSGGRREALEAVASPK